MLKKNQNGQALKSLLRKIPTGWQKQAKNEKKITALKSLLRKIPTGWQKQAKNEKKIRLKNLLIDLRQHEICKLGKS
jgi:hypothetical protein